MRKLTAGNKRSFIAFTVIIIGIIALLIYCLYIALNVPKEEYTIESNNFLYDEEYTPILSETTATIRKKWNGSYYLKKDGEKEEHKLGDQCIAYGANRRILNLYGDMYRIYMDGTVSKLTKNNEISKMSEDQLYKLGDRRYLIVGNSIVNQTGTLSTSGYLLVLIDKVGNTYLLNNELNSKTIKPITIYTETFAFDVANEKLIYNEKEIDLKKIIGSTNQYVEPKEENSNILAMDSNIVQNNNQTIINNNNGQTNINNTTTINNQQSNTNVGGVPSSSTNNGNEKKNLTKSVSLRGTTAASSYIDVEYSVTDPENKYQIVYILLETPGENSRSIALDKDENIYRITDLSPNREYKLTLLTKSTNEDGDLVETVEDLISVKTTSIQSSLKISRIGLSKVYFELYLDKNQNIDKANIVIYVNGEKKDEKEVNLESAFSTNGWQDSFTADYYSGSDIVIKIEEAKFNGKNIDVDLSTKAKIY